MNATQQLPMLNYTTPGLTPTDVSNTDSHGTGTYNKGTYLLYEIISTFVVVFQVICFYCCVVGIPGNVLIIRTFLKLGIRDNMTIVLISLAISDLCVLVTRSVEFADASVHSVYLNRFTPKIYSTFGYATGYLTTLLAVQRCLCVLLPFHFKNILNKSRTIIAVSIIGAYCLLEMAIFLWERMNTFEWMRNYFTLTPEFKSMVNRVILIDIWLRVISGTVLRPSSIVLVLVSVIALSIGLHKSVRFRHSATRDAKRQDTRKVATQGKSEAMDANLFSKTSDVNSKERKVVIQVVLVSVLYIMTSLRDIREAVVSGILGDFTSFHNSDESDLLRRFADVILFINSTVNIFIYYKFNKKFRKACFSFKDTS